MPDHPKTRILAVDDDPAILKISEVVLSSAGYEVVTCDSGAEAVRLLGMSPFDCVITDAVMPQMSGYDLVKAIRRHPLYSALPVIMLTRKRDRLDVKRAVDAGVTDYVLKPIDEHLLLEKVSLALTKGAGKRNVFELAVTGVETVGTLGFQCRITNISEADMTIRSPIDFPSDAEFSFSCPLFSQIGIESPVLRMVKSDRVVDPSEKKPYFKIKFSFVGMTEADLMKIRAWTQREAARQSR